MSSITKLLYNGFLYAPTLMLIFGTLKALVSWRRQPLPALSAAIAFFLSLILTLTAAHSIEWLQDALRRMQVPPSLWVNYYMGMYAFRSLLSTISWGLIIILLFRKDRSSYPEPSLKG
jgi:hypothetical protein